jgi:microcystin degradation protein MlrC
VADTNCKTSSPLSNPNNTTQRSDNKNITLSFSPAPHADNKQAANTIVSLTNDDISSDSQALITHTINNTSNNNTDNNKNFATAAVIEKTPSRVLYLILSMAYLKLNIS